MSTRRVDPIANFKRELTHTKRARNIQVRGIALEHLRLGAVELRDGPRGQVTKLYNGGTVGLFKADNGPIFTITAEDTVECKNPTIAEIFATLKQVQALCQE